MFFPPVFQEERHPFQLSEILLQTANSFSFSGDTSIHERVELLEEAVLSKLNYHLCPPTSLFFMEALATRKLAACLHSPTLMDCIE